MVNKHELFIHSFILLCTVRCSNK